MEAAALPLDRGTTHEIVTSCKRRLSRTRTADANMSDVNDTHRREREHSCDSYLPMINTVSASPRTQFGSIPISKRRTTYQGYQFDSQALDPSKKPLFFTDSRDRNERFLSNDTALGHFLHWRSLHRLMSKETALNALVNLTSGVIAFMLSASLAVSCASVIVGHNSVLTSCMAHFTDMNLLGTAILCTILAWQSEAPWTLGSIDVFVVPVMSQMADRIARSDLENVHEILATTIVCVALTSILLGVCFYLMGIFRVTSIANYMPYPVIAGFLAGIGANLVKNGLNMATSMPYTDIYPAMTVHQIALAVPAIFFAIIARVGQCVKWPVAISFPCLLICSVAGFHMIGTVWLKRSLSNLGSAGWVFDWNVDMVQETPMWFAWTHVKFSNVRWDILIYECFGYLISVLILGALKYSVATTSLSTLFSRDISPDNEMRVIGLANIASGVFGACGGCHYLSAMGIMKQFDAHEKMPALICAFFLLLLWMHGIHVLQYVPKFVFGGLLLNVGVHFLEAYLISPLQFLKRLEIMIVLLITSSFLVIGMLESVGLGILISIIDLIYRIHQVGCIHHETTGVLTRSSVDRTPEQMEFLEQEGSAIFILRLQGYLFFGTSVNILERIETRMQSVRCARKLKYVIIDFGLVPSFDATALINFRKASTFAEMCLFEIYYCGMRTSIERALHRNPSSVRVHYVQNDVDFALEICENELLPHELQLRSYGTVTDWKRMSHVSLWNTFIEYNDQEMSDSPQEKNARRKYLLPLAAYLHVQILHKGDSLCVKTLAKDTLFICSGYINEYTDSEFSSHGYIPGVLVPNKASKASWTESSALADQRRTSLLGMGDVPKWIPFTTSQSRLRKIGPGSIITPHTVTNVFYRHCAQSDCLLLQLKEEDLAKLELKAPHVAVEVFKLINKQLAGRFLNANKRVTQLSSLLYK